MNKRSAPNAAGFTLVELLVVIGIILILVSIALPAINVARNKAKDTQVKAGCNTIQTALEQYAVDHAGQYPGAHWVRDTAGNYTAGPGVLGGTPTFDGQFPRNDFYTPKEASDPRQPFQPDGSPNPQALDSLISADYLTDYPANPFLAAAGGVKAQMANLFWFNPIPGTSAPTPANANTLDWNHYTRAAWSTLETMRRAYLDVGRGHFSYIPLNPVNNTGYDYVGQWNSNTLTPAQLSEYYKGCRGYMLVGWGSTRKNDGFAKGLSEKYWRQTGGFDFDVNLQIDQLEACFGDISPAGLLTSEQRDSAGQVGPYGALLPGGAPNIDSAFYGAVFLKITGS